MILDLIVSFELIVFSVCFEKNLVLQLMKMQFTFLINASKGMMQSTSLNKM